MEIILKYSRIDGGVFPLKFGVAKDLKDRRDRMNNGWRMAEGKRGAKLGLCSGWEYAAPPTLAGVFGDEDVSQAAKILFGEWDYCRVLRKNMRDWQQINVPDTKFQSNGVGEIYLISKSRWVDLSKEFEMTQFDEGAYRVLIKKTAFAAIIELAANLGLEYVPLKDFELG
jgi:hypothetical protein